jgi:hypothetical protein
MVLTAKQLELQRVLSLLKPGMVGVKLKGDFDPSGTLVDIIKGDSKAAHVWLVLPNGKIATTGANFGVFYGEVDPIAYLKGMAFFLLETVDQLSDTQLLIIQACHEAMLKSGIKRFYGIWKFPLLYGLDLIHGQASRTGFNIATGMPICPICSQAVAYCLWTAGVNVGESQGKEDYTAVLPETILQEGQTTLYALQKGFMANRAGNSFLLALVQVSPFYC